MENHHKDGSFSNHVISFRLITHDNNEVFVTKEKIKSFWTTCGGMGLTGIISEITIKLKIETSLLSKNIKARNLETYGFI